MTKNKLVTLLLFAWAISFANRIIAQSSDSTIAPKTQRASSSKVSSIKNVEKAYFKNDQQQAIQEYLKLATDASSKNDLITANIYLEKALSLAKSERNKEQIAQIHRRIAKNKETQNKQKEAIFNYSEANKSTLDKSMQNINNYDIERVKNRGNTAVEATLIDKKIEAISNSNQESQELIQAMEQKAEIEVTKQNPGKAIEELNKAITKTNQQEDKVKLKEKIAAIYAKNDSLPQAITITLENIKQTDFKYNKERYLNLNLDLINYYFADGKKALAVETLEQNLALAYEHKHTESILAYSKILIKHWTENNEKEKANAVSLQLSEQLWDNIQGDSTLFQNKLFTEIEQRVALLEQEKETQAALITTTNLYNNILIIFLSLVIATTIFIVWSLWKLKKKSLQILLQSLRREMNPHFIFNSLNSVNQYIAANDERAANKYLSQYATLMRNIMSSSNKDFITLQEEHESLVHYLSLEKMRFEDQFDYQIIVADELDTYHTWIPNMLLQPFIENAIWHGLRYKQTKGNLVIKFQQTTTHIIATIQDDGIGIEASKALKTKHQQTYISRGISNTLERIATLNKLYYCQITYDTQNAAVTAEHCGTLVTISWKKIQYHVDK